MTAPVRPAPPPVPWLARAGGRDRLRAHEPPPRPWKLLVLVCLGLAALSLLWTREPTYDPWAWIIWGREVVHLDLNTVRGPSWKPLPVLFTAPFALFGDAAAPDLWLVIARAGGLLSFAMAYRLGARLAGPVAGIIAAGALVLADEYIRNFARGNSEGILVAVCLWAVERHLDGRRLDAFLLGFAAALLRPEVWPFWGLYGLWLAWQDPRRRLIVGACFAALVALWILPEWWGAGEPLRAASRARDPNPDSPAFAASPFLEVFKRSSSLLSPPVLAGAVVGWIMALAAWRRRGDGGVAIALGLVAAVLMVAVAAMTQAGFAGNLRYVALPAAFVCVLAGAGWVWLVRGVRDRFGPLAGLLALVLAIAVAAVPFRDDVDELRIAIDRVHEEAVFYGAIDPLIAKAGGEARIKACGRVFTGRFQVQAVAWRMHLHGGDVGIFPYPPGTVLAPKYTDMARDPRFPRYTETAAWMAGRDCER